MSPENFDTTTLLRAVDAIDELRGEFNDGEGGSPPQLRDDPLKLHRLAMAVINQGSRSQAADLEDQVLGMMTTLEQVQDTLSQLTALHPESLSYGGLDDVETG